MVFTELPVPETKIESGDVMYRFHGSLDYALGFISADDICMYPFTFLVLCSFSTHFISIASLGRGTLTIDEHRMLYGIIEVKSLSEMENAIPQITTQILTLLVLTYVSVAWHGAV